MARSIIPGLSVCPVDDEEGEGIEIPTLTGSIKIPESQRYGNCRSINEFEKLGTIRGGAFQIVYRCKDKKSGEIRALKKFKMPFEDGFPVTSLRETSLLKALDHVNIIRSYGVAAGKNLESNYLILDPWVLSLNDLIEKNVAAVYEKAMVKCIMKQLFHGIDYIHECLIVHRNINCSNIIFTEQGILKITGFSFSRYFTRGNMTPGITELRYRAPELLLQSKMYGPAVDIWSAGCVLARLVLKDFLFKGTTEFEVLRSISKVLGTPSDNIWAGFSSLLSRVEEGSQIYVEEIQYSDMKNKFSDQPLSLQDLLQDLLIYYPLGRSNAKVVLASFYFADEPQAHYPIAISKMLTELQQTADEEMELVNNSLKDLLTEARKNASS